MRECKLCHTEYERKRYRAKRTCEIGWEIHKTASQISRSPSLLRTVNLLNYLVDAVGGPEQLIERWLAECLRLQQQKRSSIRLPRKYEMLMTMLTQLKGRHESKQRVSDVTRVQ